MFQALTCPSSGGKIVFTQHLVSSLSVNVCTVHWLRADSKKYKKGYYCSCDNCYDYVSVTVCDCAMACDSVTECVIDYVIVRLCD